MMTSVSTEASCDALGGLESLYQRHRTDLVRLAALALGDQREAEEVVQDVFARLHGRGLRMDDPAKAPAYLRSAVLNGCRSRQRRAGAGNRARLRMVRERPPEAEVERSAVDAAVRAEVMAAIRALPARQRDCLLLRYYLDLSEAEIAATLGISAGTVKSSTARARRALAPVLEGVR